MLERSYAEHSGCTDPLQFLQNALEHAAREDSPAFIAIPAPIASADAWLRTLGGEIQVLWEPPHGPAWAGIGSAEQLTGSGHDRYEHIRERAHALWCRRRVSLHADALPVSPRCFGGLAFTPGGASEGPWSTFGDARFVVPRIAYVRDTGRAALVVTACRGQTASAESRRQLLDDAERALTALQIGRGDRAGPLAYQHGQPQDIDEISLSGWTALVAGVREQIEAGRFDKIVLSRRTRLEFGRDVDALGVLSHLRESAPGCTRFAFKFGGPTFLGATPERLITKSHHDIQTEALAGSSTLGEPAARALLASKKERAEHDLVIQEILHSLAPLASELEHPPEPLVRELRHLVHLHTPIRGKLHQPLHLLRLAERLHPTPAVGGVPTTLAVGWIREHEPHSRGWYAGPIGWFDAAGDGELWVALRSGVIAGSKAYLYAGSGIVRDSDPEREYDETRLKLASLSSALRIAT